MVSNTKRVIINSGASDKEKAEAWDNMIKKLKIYEVLKLGDSPSPSVSDVKEEKV